MIFKYKSISQNGQIVEGFYEANSEEDVVAMIKGNNQLPISIERDIGRDAQVELFKPRVKKKDLAVFCRQLYTMIDAGLSIVKSLDVLALQTENKTLRNAIISVNEEVQKGLVLSEAMKKHRKIFPSILISMVEAGEVSGNLDIILERMASHFEKENKLENKVKGALLYPSVLIVVSIAVVIFMLVAVLPTFISMFEGSGAVLPGPTSLLINISSSLKIYWYLYAAFVLILGISMYIFNQSDMGRRFFDSLKLRVPIVKSTSVKIITSRFTRTLATLISSGIPIIRAMEVVSRVVNNKLIEERLTESIEALRKGVPISRAVKDVGVFPPMVDSMIKIGEESGSLDDILNKTADFYDDEVEAALQKMTTLIEPLLIIGMALIIGFIVIAMTLPMFNMMGTI
ncbi:MAG: type II secretion system F family protein [Tissierellia bacterium]|nr:type II secretion system F family protein [Tissierellia bacterium]